MKTPHVYTLALIGIKAIHSGETRPQSRLLVSLITYTFSVMSSLDEELLMDAEEDARIVAHIQQVLPQELKEKFTEDDLYYFLDVLTEYYVHSGALDAQADDEGYVEIDEEKAAAYLEKTARKDKVGDFTAEDLLFFVDASLSYDLSED